MSGDTPTRSGFTTPRAVGTLIAVLLLPPLAMAAPAALSGLLSPSGFGYGAGTLALFIAAVAAAYGAPWTARVSGALALLTLVVTFVAVQLGARSRVHVTQDAFVLVDEQDLNVVAATALPAMAAFSPEEREGFAEALADLGRAVRETEGGPVGRQGRSGTVRYEVPEPTGTMLFLHGFGGNVTSFCWVVASAAADAGLRTECPSCGISGRWERDACAEGVRRRVEELAGNGDVVVAGLSQGAVGVSRLAPSLQSADGIVLLSGGDPSVSPPATPTLVITGDRDSRFSEARLRDALVAGPDVTFVTLEGGHFLLVKERDRVRRELGRWLGARFGR